jgi:hypothetical protein
MTLFDAQMTKKDQTYAAQSERLTQANQKVEDIADDAAALGDGRAHPARSTTWSSDDNARSIDLGTDRVQTEFHVKWINFLDQDLTRREIYPAFVETATGVWR